MGDAGLFTTGILIGVIITAGVWYVLPRLFQWLQANVPRAKKAAFNPSILAAPVAVAALLGIVEYFLAEGSIRQMAGAMVQGVLVFAVAVFITYKFVPRRQSISSPGVSSGSQMLPREESTITETPSPLTDAEATPFSQPATVEKTATVSARVDSRVNGWVDTGVDLEEDAIGVSFAIMGEIQESSGQWVGPEGCDEHLVVNPAIGQELPAGCLVARVGEQGTVDPILFSGFLPTSAKGRLYLAVNDESYKDNQGAFTVSMTVL